MGHTFRLIYHINYRKYSTGDYSYDSSNDVYNYVGSGNGIYQREQGVNFLGYNFFYTGEQFCPSTYYSYADYTNGKVWTADDTYWLSIGDIKQSKKRNIHHFNCR